MVAQLRLCRRRPANSPPQRAGTHLAPRGMTLVEVLTVAVLLGILFAMAAPSFVDTVEHAHADIAGANLWAIWSAERFYWLENRTYTTNLAALEAQGLLDPAIVAGSSHGKQDSKQYGDGEDFGESHSSPRSLGGRSFWP